MDKLKADKLVVKERGDRYVLTPKGVATAKALRLL
jgi:Mn-dependent DtxR family transcriptional regulator